MGTYNLVTGAPAQPVVLVGTDGNAYDATGGGGGGGAVTLAAGAVAASAYVSGSILAGASVDIGTGASPAANTVNARLATINTTLGTPIQATGGTVGLVAGTALVGKVGIDQTTPGTTNAVVNTPIDGTVVTVTPATSTTVLFSTSLAGYHGVAFQLSGVWVGTVTFQGSDDNSNWQTVTVLSSAGAGTATISTTNGTFYFPGFALYFRANVTAYTSGTIGGSAVLRSNAALPTVAIAGTATTITSGTVASGSSDSGSPVKIGSVANANPPTPVTAGQRINSWLGLNGQMITEETGRPYAHISTATTTTVKSGAGSLHSITINTLGTVASTITVYDNTAGSGTVIAVLNSLSTGQGTYIYNAAFATGLTLVTTGTVAPDVTVTYR